MATRDSYEQAERTAVEAASRLPAPPGRAYLVRAGRLPVSELAFDRPGAASPFGDDLHFPLPFERLTYVHPTEDAAPEHHL
jgi:succinate dehydrogenase / fumarate reductase iron-sulfur subunit